MTDVEIIEIARNKYSSRVNRIGQGSSLRVPVSPNVSVSMADADMEPTNSGSDSYVEFKVFWDALDRRYVLTGRYKDTRIEL